jgi:hypothetical protein
MLGGQSPPKKVSGPATPDTALTNRHRGLTLPYFILYFNPIISILHIEFLDRCVMDVDQLIAFDRIVREGSFSRAAWELHIAQRIV